MITEKSIQELENKLKENTTQRERIKRYKKLRFEYNYPLLFKLKNIFDRNKL